MCIVFTFRYCTYYSLNIAFIMILNQNANSQIIDIKSFKNKLFFIQIKNKLRVMQFLE